MKSQTIDISYDKNAYNSKYTIVDKSLNISKIYPKDPCVVYYDVTRLITRRKKSFATGIDRVDLEYLKQHMNNTQLDMRYIALIDDEVQIINNDVFKDYIKSLSLVWSGSKSIKDPCSVLNINGNLPKSRFRRIKLRRFGLLFFNKNLFHKNKSEKRFYFNSSHIGILSLKNKVCEQFFKHIGATLVTYIHDLIPLTHKSFSTKTAAKKLKHYTNNSLKFGGIHIFNSLATRSIFCRYFKIDFSDTNSFIQYPVIQSHYSGSVRKYVKEISEGAYFLTVGTIEARKNHILLLKIFENISQKNSSYIPKLVIVGKRGWKNDSTFNYLDEIKLKSNQIIEINDANDQEVKLLEKSALALLFPTHIEGFNLTFSDSLNLSTPKLASDISVHREINNQFNGENVTFLSNSVNLWQKEILKISGNDKMYERAFVPDCAAILPIGHNAKAVKYFAGYFDSIANKVVPLVCRDISKVFTEFDQNAKVLPYLYSRGMIKSFIKPSFSLIDFNPSNNVILRKVRKYIFKVFNYDIFEALILGTYKKIFRKYGVNNKDIFFFHSAAYYSIYAILRILYNLNFEKWPKVHLRLISVLENSNVNKSGYVKFVNLVKQIHKKFPLAHTKLTLSTETPRYTQKVISDTNYPVSILPYPPISKSGSSFPENCNYFSVGFLGSGREDKGFFRIMDIIKVFIDKYNYHSINFIVQSIEIDTIRNDYAKMHYVSQLLAHPYVELLDSRLSDEIMNTKMAECDVLCLPYDSNIYRFRGSAMLMEALAENIFVIANAGCGFSDFVPLFDNGMIANTDEEYADAIFKYLCNSSKLKDKCTNAKLQHEEWFEATMGEILR